MANLIDIRYYVLCIDKDIEIIAHYIFSLNSQILNIFFYIKHRQLADTRIPSQNFHHPV